MNKKGFTLTELIATIVILGVLMTIAIPNVLSIIERNKALNMVEDGKKFITQVEYKVRSDSNIELPKENNSAIIITLKYLNVDDFNESPYGLPYDTNSFVLIKKEGNSYKYYVNLVSAKTNSASDVNAVILDSKSRAIQNKTIEDLNNEGASAISKGSNINLYGTSEYSVDNGTSVNLVYNDPVSVNGIRDGDIKVETTTKDGYTTTNTGIYSSSEVPNTYSGSCEMQIKETTTSSPRKVYYEKFNASTGTYERVDKDSNGNDLTASIIKYVNPSKSDKKILMQWALVIDGIKYYTPLYERECTTLNSEFLVNTTYIDGIKSDHYNESSSTAIEPEDSILVTTANYQYTNRELTQSSTKRNNVLNDITGKVVFLAPYSSKYNNTSGNITSSSANTGPICETLAKLTNSICISRKQYDDTIPNTSTYSDSKFQKTAVYFINNKSIRALIDIHGFSDTTYSFAVGTRKGTTLYSNDACTLESNFIDAIKEFSNDQIIVAEYSGCSLANASGIPQIDNSNRTGGNIIKNIKNNSTVTNFSAVQIEISNSYRTSNTLLPKTIDMLYRFAQNYK